MPLPMMTAMRSLFRSSTMILRVGDRFPGGDDGELGKALQPAGLLDIEMRFGIKALDLAGDLRRKNGRVKGTDGVNAGPSPLSGFRT